MKDFALPKQIKPEHEFSVLEQEWEKAEAHFAQPNLTYPKLPRKSGLSQSFIKVNHKIYAIRAKMYVGFGGFGAAKIIKDRQNNYYALKISKDPSIAPEALSILKENGYINDFITVNFEESKKIRQASPFNPRVSMHRYTHTKTYIISKLGGSTFEQLISEIETYSDLQKILIAIQAAYQVSKLHELNLIHRDLKTDNILLSVLGNKINIQLIDFDRTCLIPSDQDFVKGFNLISCPLFTAPEAKNGRYSFASDVYAMGVLFNWLLASIRSAKSIFTSMLDNDPAQRPLMAEILSSLLEIYDSFPHSEKDADACALVAEIRNNIFKENIDSIAVNASNYIPGFRQSLVSAIIPLESPHIPADKSACMRG